MVGRKMRDLSKRDRVALLGRRAANDPDTLKSKIIVVEPLFKRFGRIIMVPLKNGHRCYALKLDSKYAKPTLEILKKIRRECPELVTDVDLMAREEPTSGKRVIDELEPLPQDHTVINDADLPPLYARRAIIEAMKELKNNTDSLSLSKKSMRVFSPECWCSRQELIEKGYRNEIDVKASWLTCSGLLLAALSDDEIKKLGLDPADVKAIVVPGTDLRDQILSQVQVAVKAKHLPPEVWDNKLGDYVETEAAVKKLVLHTVSNPYARAGLSRGAVKKLCRNVPLLATYRQVWQNAAKPISDKLLDRLKNERGFYIPKDEKKSTYIHLALTYVESKIMISLMKAIKDSLSELNIELEPGDFIYRYDALAINDRMIDKLSQKVSSITDWVKKVNVMSGNTFEIALKEIKPKPVVDNVQELNVADTVQELSIAA